MATDRRLLPHLDATLTILSLLAQTWLAKKVLELVDLDRRDVRASVVPGEGPVVTAGCTRCSRAAVLGERAWRRTLAAAPAAASRDGAAP
jgi:hypothetical protein